MNALMLLTADHNRVRGLFARFESAHENGDTAEMTTLAQEILTELEVHSKIEEQVFYPAVREASDELREMVDEGVEEHHVVDVLAAEIKALPADDEAWAAKMTVLIENVEHHAEEEEQEMFPTTRSALGEDALVAIAEQLEALKAQLGAPTLADKEGLSTDELKELAKKQQVPGRSSMTREELLATVAPE